MLKPRQPWGLSKQERHAMRQAVRQVAIVTWLELTNMHPIESRVARAEMRKRGFVLAQSRGIYYRPAHNLLIPKYPIRP